MNDSVTYKNKNGYSAILYGQSSMSVVYKGQEVLHTGSRSVNTGKEVMKLLEGMPDLVKVLSGEVKS